MSEMNNIVWSVPYNQTNLYYNKEKPQPYVRHSTRPVAERHNSAELYSLTTELTEEEKKSEYAKYYMLGPACPSVENLRATEFGAQIDSKRAFTIEQFPEIMDTPGCNDLQTGYCTLDNGVGFATTTVIGEGVTAEAMGNYIDNFMPPDDLYYKIWYPGAHFRHYAGLAIEDLGMGTAYYQFQEGISAEDVGMVLPPQNDIYGAGVDGANVLSWPLHQPDAEPLYVTMMSYYRQLEDSYEKRTTFWVGMHFVNGKTEIHLPKGETLEWARAFAKHSVWETSTFMRNVRQFWKDCQ